MFLDQLRIDLMLIFYYYNTVNGVIKNRGVNRNKTSYDAYKTVSRGREGKIIFLRLFWPITLSQIERYSISNIYFSLSML